MYKSFPVMPAWALILLALLTGCAAEPGQTASQQPAPAIAPGMARVWVLRQADPPQGNIEAARPMIYANGAAIAESREGTVFFHDFPPGSYRFAVQAFGTPARQSDTVQLAPGMQSYLQVQAEPNWEQGSSVGGWSFAVLTMSPDVARQYLPSLINLGQR